MAQKSAGRKVLLFSFQKFSIHPTSVFFLCRCYISFLPLIHDLSLYAICGKGLTGVFFLWVFVFFNLLVLSLSFFLLQIVSSHLPLSSASTSICENRCRTSLEVSTVRTATFVFATYGRDWFRGLFYHLCLIFISIYFNTTVFCSSYQC